MDGSFPSDFNFSLRFGPFKDHKINTFDSTYKTVCGDNDTVVKAIFTHKEMLEIYRTLIKNNYLRLPDTIEEHPFCQMPCCDYDLEVTMNSKKKCSHFLCGPCDRSKDTNVQRFDSIQMMIIGTLLSKPEIRKLPRTNRLAL